MLMLSTILDLDVLQLQFSRQTHCKILDLSVVLKSFCIGSWTERQMKQDSFPITLRDNIDQGPDLIRILIHFIVSNVCTRCVCLKTQVKTIEVGTWLWEEQSLNAPVNNFLHKP